MRDTKWMKIDWLDEKVKWKTSETSHFIHSSFCMDRWFKSNVHVLLLWLELKNARKKSGDKHYTSSMNGYFQIDFSKNQTKSTKTHNVCDYFFFLFVIIKFKKLENQPKKNLLEIVSKCFSKIQFSKYFSNFHLFHKWIFIDSI